MTGYTNCSLCIPPCSGLVIVVWNNDGFHSFEYHFVHLEHISKWAIAISKVLLCVWINGEPFSSALAIFLEDPRGTQASQFI